jgi:Peptidase family M1 domain/Peptidase M1 N-terminal domain
MLHISRPKQFFTRQTLITPLHQKVLLDIAIKPQTYTGLSWLLFQTKQNIQTFSLDAKHIVIHKIGIKEIDTTSLTHTLEESFVTAEQVFRQQCDFYSQSLPHTLEESAVVNCVFTQSKNSVSIQVPDNMVLDTQKTWIVVCQFEAKTPSPEGLFFIEKNQGYSVKFSCFWSQFQDESASYVFPCVDEPGLKATTEMVFSIPENWLGISNGNLVSVEMKQGKKWVHYKNHIPTPAYLMCLYAGELETLKHSIQVQDKHIGLELFFPSIFLEKTNGLFAITENAMNLLSKFSGEVYAWDNYSQTWVNNYIYGGMENASATLLTDKFFYHRHNEVSFLNELVLVHELAHQWFGDLLTCQTWSQGWLNEGFATYTEYLWFSTQYSPVCGYLYMESYMRQSYLAESKIFQRSVVEHIYSNPSEIFDRHLYQKAALILYSIEDCIGTQAFQQCIQHYVATYKYGAVTTQNLADSFAVYGYDIEPTMTQFIKNPGHIDMNVQISIKTPQEISIGICQKSTSLYHNYTQVPYQYSTKVLLVFTDKTFEIQTIFVTQWEQTETIQTTKEIAFAILDPYLSIVGQTQHNLPDIFWVNALTYLPMELCHITVLHLPTIYKCYAKSKQYSVELWTAFCQQLNSNMLDISSTEYFADKLASIGTELHKELLDNWAKQATNPYKAEVYAKSSVGCVKLSVATQQTCLQQLLHKIELDEFYWELLQKFAATNPALTFLLMPEQKKYLLCIVHDLQYNSPYEPQDCNRIVAMLHTLRNLDKEYFLHQGYLVLNDPKHDYTIRAAVARIFVDYWHKKVISQEQIKDIFTRCTFDTNKPDLFCPILYKMIVENQIFDLEEIMPDVTSTTASALSIAEGALVRTLLKQQLEKKQQASKVEKNTALLYINARV